VVSICYTIGYGGGAYQIDIWTHPEHRRKGLARCAAIAFLNESLKRGRTIYWINDVPNVASRRLAESFGYIYTGDLPTVDIPLRPYHFHRNLAQHFANYLGMDREAGELYDLAFSIQAGDSEAYLMAATAWQQAGDSQKAEKYKRLAVQA
jgi:hypothetical protein